MVFLIYRQIIALIVKNHWDFRCWVLVKFVFSKKATKIDEIFIVDLTLTNKGKWTVKILSIFVAFLENMNFNKDISRGIANGGSGVRKAPAPRNSLIPD